MVLASEVVTGVMLTIAPAYLQELHQTKHQYLCRLVMFAGLNVIAMAIFYQLMHHPFHDWWLCLPFYSLAVASLPGMSLLTHEGGIAC